MGKRKFMTSTGEVISPDRMENLFRSCFESTTPTKERLKGPKNLREFENRISKTVLEIKENIHGLLHKVTSDKWLRCDKSNKTIVKDLCNLKDHFEKNGNLILETLDPYQFLKLVLEKNASIFNSDLYILGTEIDRSGLALPQKNTLAVQCAAQVLWFLEGNKIPSITAMKKHLFNHSNPLFKLLILHRFSNQNNYESRALENWIRPMFPVPLEERKKQWINKEHCFEMMVMIPGIFTDKGINFLKLRFALICLTRILKTFSWNFDQILESKFVEQIATSIKFYPRMYVNDWICEAFASNGNIFDS